MSDYALSMGQDGTDVKSYAVTIPYQQRLLFRVAREKQFVITQSAVQARSGRAVGDYNVVPLSNGNILVRIDNCQIREDATSVSGNRYTKSGVDTEAKVKERIIRDPEGWAYEWKIWAKRLTTWRKRDFANQIVARKEGCCVYFLIPGIRVTTHQLLREDE